MGIYQSKYDYVLKDYLRRSERKNRPVRTLTTEEWDIAHDLRQIKKSANLCITEMIVVRKIIGKLNESNLYWVRNNFARMTQSMLKQRDLISATSAAFMGYKPEEEELKAILKLIKDVDKRIHFIHAVPIPENIELTPLKEYIDIVGSGNFVDELKKEFPSGADMYNSEENGKLDAYVDKIMKMIKAEGREDYYKERLMRYVKLESEREEKKKQEKKDEKLAIATNESRNGIDLFQQLFFKGVRTLDGCEKIGMGKAAIRSAVSGGHRGEFIILVCGFGNNKLWYKYLRKNGELSPRFGGAVMYKTKEEAETRMKTAIESYPGKSFAVVAI